MKPVRIRVLVLANTILTLGAVMSPAQTVLPGSGLIAHVEGKVYLNELVDWFRIARSKRHWM